MTDRESRRASFSASCLKRRIATFKGDERGSLLIFGLFCFVMMLFLAGVAIDLMRFEERRTRMMNTADRAVLAAAELNQKLDPKEVVRDHFRKEGLPVPKDSQITVVSAGTGASRIVKVDTSAAMPTWFMNLYGIKELSTPARATAQESVGNVEIALVLDVSGSMARGATSYSTPRIDNLRPAAKEFIDTMFDNVEEGHLLISIIPYSTQVAITPDLASYFNMTTEQADSDCIEFDAADFNTTAMQVKNTIVMPADRVYQRNGHFNPFYNETATASGPTWSASQLTNCTARNKPNLRVLPFSNDKAKLKAAIDGLVADGNTSIDVGVKWGAALLDPSLNKVVKGMIAAGKTDARFADSPAVYTDGDTLKVLVVMSDGENTTEYRLKPGYRENAASRVFYNTSFSNTSDLNQYSYYDPTRPAATRYYSFAKAAWRDQPYGDGTTTTCDKKGKCTTVNDPGAAANLTWTELWKRVSISYFSDRIISPLYGSTARNNNRPGGGTNSTSVYATKDTLLNNVCTALKIPASGKGAIIYSIGFDAPDSGKTALRKCASAPANFYAVTDIEIKTAFASIANSINKLRLTQ